MMSLMDKLEVLEYRAREENKEISADWIKEAIDRIKELEGEV